MNDKIMALVANTEHEDFIELLVADANDHTLRMQAMTDLEAGVYLRTVLDEVEISWAIWPDDNKPFGVGVKLIRDRFGLMKGKPDTRVEITAIACPTEYDADQMVALVEYYGGEARLN